MVRIEMLPAAHGDCLWIEYGTGARVERILIDGGPAHTYPALRERILHLPPGERRFELLAVTHIDGDHIEGVVRLLQDADALGCRFERIWFNGREQLNRIPDPAGAPLGALQGEVLGLLIADLERRAGRTLWNAGLPDGVAVVDRTTGRLPVVDLAGDCRLTLLSPDVERLLELKDHWRDELALAHVASGDEAALRRALEQARNLRPLGDVLGATDDDGAQGRWEVPDPLDRDLAGGPGDTLGRGDGEAGAQAPFGVDASRANGSSIALLLEHPAAAPTVRLLLAADAWAPVLEASVDVLRADRERLSITALKLPHHGSVANLSPSLLGKLACRNYLVSTSGAVFRHPHARAIDLLLSAHRGPGRPRLHFNYLSVTTAPWSDAEDGKARGYEALHPKGLSLSL